MNKISNNLTAHDALSLLCGKLIAKGAYRAVYENKFDKTKVVKIQSCEYAPLENINEWLAWIELQHTKAGKWLAPCHSISNKGHILIQSKTSKLDFEQYPKEIPKFLTDTKYENYGVINGEFVCHDYGSHLLMTYGCKLKMKKAEWYQAYY